MGTDAKEVANIFFVILSHDQYLSFYKITCIFLLFAVTKKHPFASCNQKTLLGRLGKTIGIPFPRTISS
jgi:hypothetical protein